MTLPRQPLPAHELWNVSFLPTVKTTPSALPPDSPSPTGRALQAPALLSVSEGAVTQQLPVAA